MNTSHLMPYLSGYELLDRLGEGAAGVVYKARQLSTGQLVAIKVLHQRDASGESAHDCLVANFARETQLCAQLYHPHIVRLLDKGETDTGELFAVFEYISGNTLHDLLLRDGALSAKQAGDLMGQVLDALVAAHELGIAHRDLKPMNIMVSLCGAQLHAKLLDFGIGTFATGLIEHGHDQIPVTDILGTPRYSAPEQLRGEPPTVKSDLYAWGLILLECLTGKPAIDGTTLGQIYHQQLSANEVPIPTDILYHPLADILRRVLSKNPQQRNIDTRELYSLFHQIDLQDITVKLNIPGAVSTDVAGYVTTRISESVVTERRQITILCYSVDIIPIGGKAVDLQIMEEVLNDQLKQCQDTCLAYRGYPAGSMGNTRMLFFGYPQASDKAARQAARAALEMLGQGARGSRLAERHGISVQIRIALHTGFIVIRQGIVPTCLAAVIATRLVQLAEPDTILVSQVAQSVLERHFLLETTELKVPSEDRQIATTWLLLAESEGEASTTSRQLLGRDTEFSILQNLWHRANAGMGGAVMLIGEPGIGKTHLVQNLCEYVRDAKGCVWVLQCLPEQRNSALYPFLSWLSSQFQLQNQSDQALAGTRLQESLQHLGFDVSNVLPILCSWMSLPIPDDLTAAPHAPSRQRQIMLDTLSTLLHKMASGPAILVLEDVHWIDPTSRELLDSLLSNKGVSHLGILFTAWPECDYQPQLERLQLSRLGETEAKALVQHMASAQILGDSELAQVIARADGNPLYLTELTRSRINLHLHLEKESKNIELIPEIPASLRDVLSQTLDRLGPAKETVQLAAALGREFDQSILINTALRDEAAVQRDLEQMFLADIVYRQRRAKGDSFSFRHALIRDAAYDSMTHSMRRQTHTRIANVLEMDDAQANTLSLSQHYAAAEIFDRAVLYGTRATSQSLSHEAHDEAINLADLVQTWIKQIPQSQRNAAELDLNLIATQAMMSKFGWADSRVRISAERSHLLLTGIEDQQHVGAALWALATYHHVAGDRERVRILAQKMVELGSRDSSPALQRAAHTFQGMAYWIDGHYPEAAASLEQVLLLPAAEHNRDAIQFGLDCRCWSLAALAIVRWFLDDDETVALALGKSAVVAAEEINHIPTLGLTLMYQAFLYQYRQDRAGVAEACGRLLDLSRRFSLPAIEAYAAIIDCWVREDVATLTQILNVLQAMGCQLGLTYLMSLAADLMARAGDLPAAVAEVDRCLRQATNTGERYYEAELLLQKANLLLNQPSPTFNSQILPILVQAISCAKESGMEYTRRRAASKLEALLAT